MLPSPLVRSFVYCRRSDRGISTFSHKNKRKRSFAHDLRKGKLFSFCVTSPQSDAKKGRPSVRMLFAREIKGRKTEEEQTRTEGRTTLAAIVLQASREATFILEHLSILRLRQRRYSWNCLIRLLIKKGKLPLRHNWTSIRLIY